MKTVPAETDYIVVGAGVAGMRAAIELAAAGRVLVLAKSELTESATQYAQGGVAVALSDEDEISLHLQDTLDAGDGLSNPEAAKVLVEEGPARIQELIEWGTEFDRHGTKLTFTREGAHSRSRILHAHGDSTGREIGRALYAKAATLKNISFWEWEFTADVCVQEGHATGIRVMNDHGEARPVHARAVLLATGGLGQVYRETTNPSVATGDGVAMAFRAGAELQDMEFVQFHPTALYVQKAPRFLLSEALRGEGGYLRNAEMQHFMPKYHDMAELAPRDVVARAIAHELEISTLADPVVYLDLTHLGPDHLARRFPRIHATCLQYNIDIGTDLIPVRPAAHYAMGGVRTDLQGRTSVPGLYAAGEAACTGVHGANRLASNSLLEGLVYGARAGATMREEVDAARANPNHGPSKPCKIAAENPRIREGRGADEFIRAVRDLAWKNIGIVRSGTSLRQAIEQLESWRSCLPAMTSRRHCEANNVFQSALLIARSALSRQESRGAHYRLDYPSHNDARFKKHSIVRGETIRFE
jgi:L-aspartate oxidase